MLEYTSGNGKRRAPMFNLPRRKFVRNLWYFIGLLLTVHFVDFSVRPDISGFFGIAPGNTSSLWNIGTAWLVHGDMFHVFMNCFFILIMGMYMENFAKVFWRVTVLTAVGSGAIIWFLGEPGTLHLGASGIGFGYMGFLGIITIWMKGPGAKQIKTNVWVLLFINLVITFAMPGISITGHVGGLIVGAMLGLYYLRQYAGRSI